jgi:alanyl aminopeptidase
MKMVFGLLSCLSAIVTYAQIPAPAGQLDSTVRPLRYELNLSIDPSREVFAGETRIDVMLTEPLTEIWMHGESLEIVSARLQLSSGQSIAAEFEQQNITGSARLTLEEIAPAGQAALYFSYTAPYSSVNAGLFRSERDGQSYVASQLAPTHARAVFPSFDEPRFKVPFDISVTARVDDVVITNAPEAATEPRGNGQVRHVFATTEPLPTYLVAIAVGPYDVVTWDAV